MLSVVIFLVLVRASHCSRLIRFLVAANNEPPLRRSSSIKEQGALVNASVPHATASDVCGFRSRYFKQCHECAHRLVDTHHRDDIEQTCSTKGFFGGPV